MIGYDWYGRHFNVSQFELESKTNKTHALSHKIKSSHLWSKRTVSQLNTKGSIFKVMYNVALMFCLIDAGRFATSV